MIPIHPPSYERKLPSLATRHNLVDPIGIVQLNLMYYIVYIAYVGLGNVKCLVNSAHLIESSERSIYERQTVASEGRVGE